MARAHLGETIDIHAGAKDLKFPHHENEIAQSEAASGEKFVNYWIHGGLLKVEGQKMSKSLGNYIEAQEIGKRGFDPLALRYLCLTTHYRSELNFTWKSLEASQRALKHLCTEVSLWGPPGKEGCQDYEKAFLEAVSDDLDFPQALSLVWKMIKDPRPKSSSKKRSLLKMDKVLGLSLAKVQEVSLTAEIRKLVSGRERLRKKGRWEEADAIRKDLEKKGYFLEDTPRGTLVKKA
jgi:cysteinyl-tRNA synthetase